jgi:hypothetical protein
MPVLLDLPDTALVALRTGTRLSVIDDVAQSYMVRMEIHPVGTGPLLNALFSGLRQRAAAGQGDDERAAWLLDVRRQDSRMPDGILAPAEAVDFYSMRGDMVARLLEIRPDLCLGLGVRPDLQDLYDRPGWGKRLILLMQTMDGNGRRELVDAWRTARKRHEESARMMLDSCIGSLVGNVDGLVADASPGDLEVLAGSIGEIMADAMAEAEAGVRDYYLGGGTEALDAEIGFEPDLSRMASVDVARDRLLPLA